MLGNISKLQLNEQSLPKNISNNLFHWQCGWRCLHIFSSTYGAFYSIEVLIILNKSVRENKSEEICINLSATLRAVTLQKDTTKANGICTAWFVDTVITYYLQSCRHEVFRPLLNFVCIIYTMLMRLCTFQRWKSCQFYAVEETFLLASISKHKAKSSLFPLTFKT